MCTSRRQRFTPSVPDWSVCGSEVCRVLWTPVTRLTSYVQGPDRQRATCWYVNEQVIGYSASQIKSFERPRFLTALSSSASTSAIRPRPRAARGNNVLGRFWPVRLFLVKYKSIKNK